MAIRANHYDAAFEEYLRMLRLPYVAVDEARRALSDDASLKSPDFIVYSKQSSRLLVEVKGRRFPTGGKVGGHLWENWVTEDDVTSLLQWQDVFGTEFRSLIVFAYDIAGERWRPHHERVIEHRDHSYSFYGVWANEYSIAMRTRSPSWQTVSLPSSEFRKLRQPIESFL